MIPKKLAPDLIRGVQRFSDKITRKTKKLLGSKLHYPPSILRKIR
jgi:hypothetical protein